MMTLVVVYLYTVLAFNFFRKFYVQESEEGDDPDRKCHNMLTVYVQTICKIVSYAEFLSGIFLCYEKRL